MQGVAPWLFVSLLFLSGSSEEAFFEAVEPTVSGIQWRHENAMSEPHYLPETMGAGAAFLDYNQDGWMDLYLVNSGSSDFYQPDPPLRNALYRSNQDGSFSDVTEEAGVAAGTFGMGVAAADFDNDAYPDLYVTAYGQARLYHNQGDGTFADITETSGAGLEGWSSSAVWFDSNNDGLLDLFVARYVVFTKETHVSCGLNPLGKSYYCVPRLFPAVSSVLFRNNGDKTFSRISADTALELNPGKALGAIAADFNNDRRLDLFVANDTVADQLFFNRGDNRWEETGIFAGVAYSLDGKAQSGMGVDAADLNQDGWLDLFVANIDHQNYSLFQNNGDESFTDLTVPAGIAEKTFLLSGWGMKFFDFDLDGDLDLFIANGHPDDMISEYSSNVTYREPLLLLENREGRLTDISTRAGPVFSRQFSGRGLAVGDFNNDGRPDVLVSNNGERPLLLANRAGGKNHWLGVQLEGTQSNRDGVGAELTWAVGSKARSLRIHGGGSYLSSHDPRRVLGLGSSESVDYLEITWPSGRRERFTDLPVDRYVRVEEGTGEVRP